MNMILNSCSINTILPRVGDTVRWFLNLQQSGFKAILVEQSLGNFEEHQLLGELELMFALIDFVFSGTHLNEGD